jgi:hypothetical protein
VIVFTITRLDEGTARWRGWTASATETRGRSPYFAGYLARLMDNSHG